VFYFLCLNLSNHSYLLFIMVVVLINFLCGVFLRRKLVNFIDFGVFFGILMCTCGQESVKPFASSLLYCKLQIER